MACLRSKFSITCFVVLLSLFLYPTKAHAETPEGVTHSNVAKDRFVISWTTANSAQAYINYGPTPSLGNTAYDVRGQTAEGTTHYVHVTGLSANTVYYYDIVCGGVIYNNGGAHNTVTTGAILSPAANSDIAYGQAFLADGVTPARDSIVYIKLRDNNGLGTIGDSQLFSYLVDYNGYWYVDLKNIKNASLNAYFEYSDGDSLVIAAKSTSGGSISFVVDTAADTPASSMTIIPNAPPVLNNIGNKIVNETALLQFTVSATDPNGDVLIYSASNLPSGATFDAATKTFTWTPDYTQSGAYDSVRFEVTDGTANATEDITITVANTNRPPVLTAIGSKAIAEGALLEFILSATDPDGDPLIYSASNLPSGAAFDAATKTFTWTPDYTQSGAYNSVHFEVTDGTANATEDITITVNDTDGTPPVTSDNYDGLWHKDDFSIDLTATDGQSGVAATYYKINDGPTQSLVAESLPFISTEGGSNKLEYWSVDNNGNEELPHKIITTIKLDKTVPTVNIISPANDAAFSAGPIAISGTAQDALSGIKNVTVNVEGTIYNPTVGVDGSFSVTGVNITGGLNSIRASAFDMADNTSKEDVAVFLGWVLHLQIPYSTITDYYSGAASSQMILNYMRNGVGSNLTQQEIYDYGHPYNLPQNSTLLEMDPRAVEHALGHFDPYDLTDPSGAGDAYKGYNFTIEVFDSEKFTEYLRDVIHWMAYPVTINYWWLNGDLVKWPNTPAAVPAYGTYNHWIVVNGAATSENPIPEPHTNPWYTPNFTVYGLWLTDPATGGIGQDLYVTAQSAQETFLFPVTTSDSYNGKYLQVAEPPHIQSKADVKMAEPKVNDETLEIVKISRELAKEIPNTLSEVGKRMESAKRHLYDAALVIDLQDNVKTVADKNSSSQGQGKDLLNSVFNNGQSPLTLDWRKIIDSSLFADENFVKAFDGSQARSFVKVTRADKENSFYYLISFDKYVKGQFLTYAAIIIDAQDGSFKEASWVEEPTRFIQVTEERAMELILSKDPELQNTNLNIELIWQPGGYSQSPFYPYWKATSDDKIYFVTQKGEVISNDWQNK